MQHDDEKQWSHFLVKENFVLLDELLPGDFIWIVDSWNTAGVCLLGLALTMPLHSRALAEVDVLLLRCQKICTFRTHQTKVYLISRCNLL